jgi:hypothetical protein
MSDKVHDKDNKREYQHRQGSDRARKRAIRSYASQAGVPYSVAARHLASCTAAESPANRGRTVYPHGSDEHRRWLIALREDRPYELRVRDTRIAGTLPMGRAEHLVHRFPTTRGEPGTGVGPLYHGDSRLAMLAMLYAVVAHELPKLRPSSDELAWIADLGEETAVDIACHASDRAARFVLDGERWRMWSRVEAALSAAARGPDRPARHVAAELGPELRCLSLLASVDGTRHTLDALLTSTDSGHAPGTRVRIRTRPYRGRTATIVGVRWAASGRPVGYDVQPDAVSTVVSIDPDNLTLLGTTVKPQPV